MSRRVFELVSITVAAIVLAVLLWNATLVDRRAPSVDGISLGRPAGDSRVGTTHTTIDVSFSEAVDRASAERRFAISPAVSGTFTWDGSRTLIFTPNAKLPVATEFHVSIAKGYQDLAGNVSEAAVDDWPFRTVGLPTIVASEPASGATGVAVDADITLNFDRLMDVGATEAAITVVPAVPFRADWSGTSVLLSPLEPFAFGTRYQVQVSSRAADTDGNALSPPVDIGFTTVAAGLGLRAVIPADGSAGAPVDGPIAMRFDGPVDPTSTVGRFQLTPPAEGELRVVDVPSDVVGAAPGSDTLIFQPRGTLAPHTTYTVELLTGVKRAGSEGVVAAARTWSFTTGAPTDTLQNQIVFIGSRTGVPNIWAMNPDGSNARQLTHELTPVTAYDVSADGRRLVYSAAGLVKVLPLGDGGATIVTPSTEWDYAPRFLPDGTSVIVGRRDRATGEDRGTWLIPVDGGPGPRQLLAGGAPPVGSVAATDDALQAGGAPGPWTSLTAVASDGTVALISGAGGEVTWIDLATYAAVPVGLRDPQGPFVWSDQLGGFVVEATRPPEQAVRFWLVREDGSLSAISGGGAWPAISSRGDLAWITEGGDGSASLAFRAAGAGSAATLAGATDVADRQPTFSPAGDQLVFVRVPAGGQGASLGVWAVRTDGRDLRQLAADGSAPRWLP